MIGQCQKGLGHARAGGRRAADAGFVLISILWIAGLLAVVATAFTIGVRSQILAGGNAVQNGRAEFVADGMVRLTALRLSAADLGQVVDIKLNGEPMHCSWAKGIAVSVSVQDQGGLVDLNTAPEQLISALVQGLGNDRESADRLIAALRDFRDPDSQAADGGSEPVVYPGESYGPKNAPLAIAEEIDQIPELDDELFRKLMPFVTVYSQQAGIDITRAPQGLLRALGVSDAGFQFAAPSPGKLLAIDVTTELSNGSRYRRHAAVSLLRQPDRPFAILAWQRGGDIDDMAAANFDAPSCIN